MSTLTTGTYEKHGASYKTLTLTDGEYAFTVTPEKGGMATSFTKAALGAEGIGKDVTMIVGNGYTKDHADITLNVLRENPKLRKLFEEKYV